MGIHKLTDEIEYLRFDEMPLDRGLHFHFKRKAAVGTSVATGARIVWTCDAVGVSNEPFIVILSTERKDGRIWANRQKTFYEFDFLEAWAWLEENTT